MAAYFRFDRQEEMARWVQEKIGCEAFQNYAAIGWEEDGRLIAGVVYHDYLPKQKAITASIAGEGRWATKRSLNGFFRYPFMQLQVNRITVCVRADNPRALDMDRRLGFVEEGRLRLGYGDADMIVFGMLKHECRWLRWD